MDGIENIEVSVKRIAIIGAGASGLTAIKCCLDEGLEPVCFERNSDIGGLWRYEDGIKKGATVYKSTVINTSKELMSYSDFPMPKEWPNFLHNSKVQEYYRSYAERFQLVKHIKFNTDVISCTQTPDHRETGKWIIKSRNHEEDVTSEEEFDGVLVAVGHHADPYFPKDDFSGIHYFQGKIIHSHDYRSFEGFENKNVLIIGIGNSGVDIAVELSQHAKQVYLSTRRGAWIFSRVGPFGMPADFLGVTRYQKLMQDYLPESWARTYMEDMLTKKFDHAHYGLQPSHGPFNQHLTMNDDLPARIITGSVKIKSNLSSVLERRASFEDGSEEDVDCIIFATGYKYFFPFLPNSIVNVKDNGGNLYKYMWPMSLNRPTLAIIGHVQAFGAVNPISEMQCRWATRVFKGEVALPPKERRWRDIFEKRLKMKKRFYASQRHSIEVDHIDYMDQIAEQIHVKPNLLKLFFYDYALAKKLLYEVSSPYQYRLFGPGRWSKARETIMGQKKRMLFPLHTRKVKKQRRNKPSVAVVTLVALIAIFMFYFIFN